MAKKFGRATVRVDGKVVGRVTSLGRGVDFVGFYASGTIYRGFASSLGQRNWHEVENFNFVTSTIRDCNTKLGSVRAEFHCTNSRIESMI